MRLENQRPKNYSTSKSRIALYILRKLLPHVIKSNLVKIDYYDSLNLETQRDSEKFILAPPSLWAFIKIFIFPAFQSGETYKNGEWYLKQGSLTHFLEEVYRHKDRLFFRYFLFTYRAKYFSFMVRQRFFTRYFTRKVRHHYEFDSDLYSIFLDAEMVYTCAFFENEKDQLSIAQSRKLDTVIERMKLPNGKIKLLEIGCGWGSLARRVVKMNPEIQYTGLTIAKDQIKRAKLLDNQRLTSEQNNRINYLLEDYLDHIADGNTGYDGIAVIGMMEHVGLGHYDKFLQKICSLLKFERRAVIHTIISDKSGEPTNTWIDKHIFHGGYAPSLAEITHAVEKCSCKIEIIFVHKPDHYRRTIECWLHNFEENWDSYKSNNLATWSNEKSDELFRTWHFYLSSVRNMFVPTAMNFQVAHIVIIKA